MNIYADLSNTVDLDFSGNIACDTLQVGTSATFTGAVVAGLSADETTITVGDPLNNVFAVKALGITDPYLNSATLNSLNQMNTKGDLLTFSTVPARLGVGTDGQGLIADSATATGLTWGSPLVDANDLIGTTLASNVVNSSLTSLGTITNLNAVTVNTNTINGRLANTDITITPLDNKAINLVGATKISNGILYSDNLVNLSPGNDLVLYAQDVGNKIQLLSNLWQYPGLSITSDSFIGNASSATILQTARNINGVAFNGSADITVACAASTLTGTTLASNVVSSSLSTVSSTLNGRTLATLLNNGWSPITNANAICRFEGTSTTEMKPCVITISDNGTMTNTQTGRYWYNDNFEAVSPSTECSFNSNLQVNSGKQLMLNSTTNQIRLGNTNTTTISSPAPTSSRTVTLPDAGTNSSFVLTELAQTINGSKTFSSQLIINPTTNQIRLGTTNTTTITSPAPSSSRTVTLPDAGTNSSFVLTEGTQTINGSKTHNGTININASNNAATNIGTGTTSSNVSIGGSNNALLIGSSTYMSAGRYLDLDYGFFRNVSSVRHQRMYCGLWTVQQSIVYSVVTRVTWSGSVFNATVADSGYSLASNQLTLPSAGRYLINAKLAWNLANTYTTHNFYLRGTSSGDIYNHTGRPTQSTGWVTSNVINWAGSLLAESIYFDCYFTGGTSTNQNVHIASADKWTSYVSVIRIA